MKRVFEAICDSYEIEIRMLDEQIGKIHALHCPIDMKYEYLICQHCETNYPCATIKILEDK